MLVPRVLAGVQFVMTAAVQARLGEEPVRTTAVSVTGCTALESRKISPARNLVRTPARKLRSC